MVDADAFLWALRDVLSSAETALNERTTIGAPDCLRISHGEPTWDCEGLFVSGQIRPEFSAKCALMSHAQICVQLLRCVTPLKEASTAGAAVPDCDLLADEAEGLAVDGWALWTGLVAQWKAGTLFGTAPLTDLGCEQIRWGDLVPLRPQGGLAGWRMCFDVTMPGAASVVSVDATPTPATVSGSSV